MTYFLAGAARPKTDGIYLRAARMIPCKPYMIKALDVVESRGDGFYKDKSSQVLARAALHVAQDPARICARKWRAEG